VNQLVRRARAATREAVVASTLHSSPGLHRVLTFWPLLFYGLGVIVGAGIYVATGTVIERAGHAAPFSFLLAGVAAGLTGLCYAELGARFPEAAGGASYVRHGFGANWLTLITAAATTLAVAVSAASIAHGTIQYLGQVLPLPPQMLLAVLIVGFTGIAAVGVRSSVGLAAAVGALEIGGLLVATLAGWLAAPELHFDGMIPTTAPAFGGAVAGAFIAFFAYVGFETLANMAEEIKDPGRTLPRGILAAIVASTILYIAVSSAVILSDRTGANPLIGMFEGRSASLFALVGSLSVANGVMVEIIMLARLFYGMGQKGQLPAALARVHPRTRTPLIATVLAGAIVLATALLFPFQHLLITANALTLSVFVLVDLALWRVHRANSGSFGGFRAPAWVPPVAAVVSAALIAGEFLF
jgi:basic amino acid/polyamine antiporter, APA family